jgi:hypothetical protein
MVRMVAATIGGECLLQESRAVGEGLFDWQADAPSRKVVKKRGGR